MNSKPILMAFWNKTGKEFKPTEAHVVAPRTWWQRICWRLLASASTPYLCEHSMIRQVYCNPEMAEMELIRFAIVELNRTGIKPTKLLIGVRNWTELINDPHILPYLQAPFSFPLRAEIVNLRGAREFLGLEVQVIPHMDGVLVL